MGTIYQEMYDSVGDVPAYAQIIGAYTDGIYENYERLQAAHPEAFMVGITATGIHDKRTRVADCEKFDLTPAGMAQWSYDEKTKYGGPGDGYWSLSLHDEVAAEMEKLGLVLSTDIAKHDNNLVNWWCADYVNHPFLAPGSVATQFEDAGPWDVTSTNGVWPINDPSPVRQPGGIAVNSAGMMADPKGRGYWIVGTDGGVFTYSNDKATGEMLPFYGSLGGKGINNIVGGCATPDGGGYWLVGADGGVFAFGNAQFHGSGAGVHWAKPATGIAAHGNDGYWIVFGDGGIANYGSAPFLGSAAS